MSGRKREQVSYASFSYVRFLENTEALREEAEIDLNIMREGTKNLLSSEFATYLDTRSLQIDAPGPKALYEQLFETRADIFETDATIRDGLTATFEPISEIPNNYRLCPECGGDVLELEGVCACGKCGLEDPTSVITTPDIPLSQEKKDEIELWKRYHDSDVRSNIE